MGDRREIPDDPGDGVEFAPQGEGAARPWELTDEEREAFENRPRFRGPIWIVLPLVTIAVVTLPLWGTLALAHLGLTATIVGIGIAVWPVLRRLSRRPPSAQ
jgi:hypothetical protein